jgi:hypothetical protein
MPSSPLVAAPFIVQQVLRLRPRRVLDLGIGAGKYGFLLREQHDFSEGRMKRDQWELTIDGVEAYESYVAEHQPTVYDTIFISDVEDFLEGYRGASYDVVLALDIIEHLPPTGGLNLTRRALEHGDLLFISTPKNFFRQDHLANPLETHLSWWPRTALDKLAELCGAQARSVRVGRSTISVIGRPPLPSMKVGRALDLAVTVKDAVIPQRLYYRARGQVGPTILDISATMAAETSRSGGWRRRRRVPRAGSS